MASFSLSTSQRLVLGAGKWDECCINVQENACQRVRVKNYGLFANKISILYVCIYLPYNISKAMLKRWKLWDGDVTVYNLLSNALHEQWLMGNMKLNLALSNKTLACETFENIWAPGVPNRGGYRPYTRSHHHLRDQVRLNKTKTMTTSDQGCKISVRFSLHINSYTAYEMKTKSWSSTWAWLRVMHINTNKTTTPTHKCQRKVNDFIVAS